MSDNTTEEHHSGPIKTTKQFFWVSVGAFVVPMFVIIGLVSWITSGNDRSPGETNAAQKLEQRIAPVASFKVGQAGASEAQPGATLVASAAPAAPAAGADPAAIAKKLYESTCIACHGTGAAGAPKFGDKAAWAPRIALGEDKLVDAAIHGIGAMPPRGGSQATDAEMRDTVVYIANAAGANFPEPSAAPAAPAPAAAAPAAGAAAQPAAEPAAAAPAAAPKAAPAAAAQKVDLAEGKKLYESTCIACHGTGAAGAPKFGNQADWAPRIKLGLDKLVDVAIHGLGAMPPRGGSQATDAQLRDAVVYMTDHSGAHFDEAGTAK